MNLVQLSSQRSYWETFMSYDGVSSVISHNRFDIIIRNVHFVNNMGIMEDDKKTKPVVETQTIDFKFTQQLS